MDSTHVQEDTVLDARGLLCPMPIIKMAKLMKGLAAGTIVKLITSDRGSVADVPAWAESTGNDLLEHSVGGDEFTFFIRKG